MVLRKSDFCEVMSLMEKQIEAYSSFIQAIKIVIDERCEYDEDELYQTACLRLLKIIFCDDGDWIDHWLFESHAKGFSWGYTNENSTDRRIETHDELYDFLIMWLGDQSLGNGTDTLLSKSEFKEIVGLMMAQQSKFESFNDALNHVGDGHYLFASPNGNEQACMLMLKRIFDDTGDWLSYWFYEADCKGFSWWKDNAAETEHRVETLDDLYDFLIDNKEAHNEKHPHDARAVPTKDEADSATQGH